MVERKLEDFGVLLSAEEQIVNEIDTGETIKLGNGSRPSSIAQKDRIVRAGFIRYLALGGCKKCTTHESGLDVVGATVDGILNLSVCIIGGNLMLRRCVFTEQVLLRSTTVSNLNLSESYLQRGLRAGGITVSCDLFIDKAIVDEEVHLIGAKLGHDLVCAGSKFRGKVDTEGKVLSYALSADGLVAGGSVFLPSVEAIGGVRFLGAKIGNDLVCECAKFENVKKEALSLDNIDVKGSFFWRNNINIVGKLKLDAATVGSLVDDCMCWPNARDLSLNGFQYGAIMSESIDAKSRIEWLSRQDLSEGFWPQPYEQLAKVLHEMGHGADAKAVLIEKEKLQRATKRERLWNKYLYGDAQWHWFWDWVLGGTISYGHKPLRAFGWLAFFWTIGVLVFFSADLHNAFQNTTKTVPVFNALIYSADTLLPIIDFKMQKAWIPDTNVKTWGLLAQIYLWFQIAIGWGLSLLAVAGFSGLIKSD